MGDIEKRSPRVGLLPLYLKLYDDTTPEHREKFVPFMETVADGLASRGVDVVRSDVCRVADEFAEAVHVFEDRDVDCIVTLHLAYSASLESAPVLAKTELPILILDTTMDPTFGVDTSPDRIMYNHGIHGVMDLASVLRRRGKPFRIVAGHVTESDVLDRAAAQARAARAARCLRSVRALRIGEAFKGMGDFSVEESVLRDKLGITVDEIGLDELSAAAERVTDRDIADEMKLDRERFTVEAPEEVHARSVRVGLGLRRLLEEGKYTAFSMNFLAFDRAEGPASTVPFLEASKAMSRGIGYAGEGDVLTAALVHALAAGFGGTTFTEIFCPDWRGDSLFLSHMGEINPDVAAVKPRLVEKPFPYTAAENPAVLTCAPRPGPAVFANLAPGPQDTFCLIVAPVRILGDATNEEMRDSVRGWMRPRGGVAGFLEAYSRCGGTHHSALVLGAASEALEAMAAFAGLDSVRISEALTE